MSDRTWYLFGETLKAELKDLVRQQRSWYETEKELAEQGFHSDGHEDFEEKEKYWEAHLDGYLAFCNDAIGRIDKLYKKLGMD